ncbi:MAG TPA: glutaminyl-peptide cyclotransferase [Pyrinomonadaceae bacterium]|nr:glutaminyl-peptide cyclotransferase [Pyrinomonadaceae bacterium]
MTIGPYLESFTKVVVLMLAVSCLGTSSCGGSASNVSTPDGTPTYGFEVVNTFKHATDSFTQGLEYREGKLYESAGGDGTSSLRLVELETGRVLDKVDVPMPYFAEGLTLLNGKIYQLTWQNGVGFIYDSKTFSKIGQFNYDGEGWGLTNDGQSLILSDGTNSIRFLDPGSFKVTKTIAVLDGNKPIASLNELEYFDGQIYSNIWHRDQVAIINPQTGKVTAWLNLKGLLQPGEVRDEEAVLNGIAYDSTNKRLFVTGKLWPKLFEIRVKH